MIALGTLNAQMFTPELYRQFRIRYAAGHGGYPLVGDPDHVAAELAKVSAAGFAGICFSFVNFLDEVPYFRDEVLPRLHRMGLRDRLADG